MRKYNILNYVIKACGVVVILAVVGLFLKSQTLEMVTTAYPSVLRNNGRIIYDAMKHCGSRKNFCLQTTNAATSAQYFTSVEKMFVEKKEQIVFNNAIVVPGIAEKGEKLAGLNSNSVNWSVAVNVPRDVPDNFPILVSRNIDVTTLSLCVTDRDKSRMVMFNTKYHSISDYYGCVIYADGKALTFSRRKAKGISYRNFYRNQTLCITNNGAIKYLTPVSKVVLNH